jgi:hypothetical protein
MAFLPFGSPENTIAPVFYNHLLYSWAISSPFFNIRFLLDELIFRKILEGSVSSFGAGIPPQG